MSWRLMLILVLFTALGLGYWWLDTLMQNQAWFSQGDKGWKLAAQGWWVILHAWPVTLAGLLFGGGGTLILATYSYAEAEKADHLEEINKLQARVEVANNKATLAEQHAWDELEGQRENLASHEKQLQKERQELAEKEIIIKQQIELAGKRIKSANERIQLAEKEASFAKVKRDRAAGAFHRLKQKR